MKVSGGRGRSPLVVGRYPIAVVVLVAALVLTGAAPATALLPAQKQALGGIRAAAARGQLDPATAGRDRTLVNRAAGLIRRLPPGRAAYVASALGQVGALAARYSTPRALTLFGQLQVNEQWFAQRGPPPDKTDVTDTQGVVYRFFPGRGFEFHPLANFGALNEAVAAQDAPRAKQLAQALVARGIRQPGGGIGWEYEFDFAGGHAPWLSGMAQAVAAQAFARASTLLGDPTLMGEARAAFRTIPGPLVQSLPAGPWIKLYAFNRNIVLNAQLQAVVSLADYAGSSDDSVAASLASALQQTALAELPRFDTGYWSYYALPHTISPLDYQQYVVTLLQKLAPKDPAFAAAATRFNGYDTQPPAFKLADAAPGALKFWLSKPASVLVTATGPPKRLSLANGWHVLTWKLPGRAGIYPVELTARDWAGNSASIEALPLVRVAQAVAATRRFAANAPSPSALLGQPSFAVGVGLDSPAQASLAVRERFGTVRLSVPWSSGQTAPDATTVSALYSLAAHNRLVVELVPTPLPTDDTGRAAFASFAGSLVQQAAGIHDVLLGPPPSAATASSYASALGALYDAVKAIGPGIQIGGELDGAAAPLATLNALARAFKASGRAAPLFDELAFHPVAVPTPGAWGVADYSKVAGALTKAFGGTPQPAAPPLLFDRVTTASGLGDADQAAAYQQLLETASCQPQVAGVLFSRLVDSQSDTSGLFAADGTPKASAALLKPTIAAAQRGSLATCPGLGEPAATSVLAFPGELSAGAPAGPQLGCSRDCLYLVTLDRASDGKPVLATRGVLAGGAAPVSITLPSVRVALGTYVLSVRVVTQWSPGPVSLAQSPLLAAT